MLALSEMLSVDVRSAVRMGVASDSFTFCMFHNLGHITVESGEYLRAFRAWGEAHKTLQTVSQLKNESIQETIESFTSNDKGLLKASKAPIDHAISKWLSIKQEVASSEYRCFCQTLGLMLVISQP